MTIPNKDSLVVAGNFRQRYSAKLPAYLRIIHMQFDLLKTKSLMMKEAAYLPEDILELKIRKDQLAKEITDAMQKERFSVVEIEQIEQAYESFLKDLAIISLKE